MQDTGFLFVTFVLAFCGALAVLLLMLMQKMCLYQDWLEKVKERLATVEDITVDKLSDLRASLQPYSNIVWALGHQEYNHIVRLKDKQGSFIVQHEDGELFGDQIVRVQATLPGHDISIGVIKPRCLSQEDDDGSPI